MPRQKRKDIGKQYEVFVNGHWQRQIKSLNENDTRLVFRTNIYLKKIILAAAMKENLHTAEYILQKIIRPFFERIPEKEKNKLLNYYDEISISQPDT
jgi:hypothetical protein